MDKKISFALVGGAIGLVAVVLVYLGNPVNMGICVACFLRDTAGGIGLMMAKPVQYIRPETIGFVLGAFILSLGSKEFSVQGGSSPLIRFVVAIFMMIGALVFLGCPLRMVLRLAGGDLNALVGLFGFILGIFAGTQFLKRGYTLGRAQSQSSSNGFIIPALMASLLVFLIIKPAFIYFSTSGPGSMHAPVVAALIAGLLVGAIAQRYRVCMAGGVRDLIIIKRSNMALVYISIFVVVFLGNLMFGTFKLSFADQPVAHTDAVWNFLGLGLVGYAATLIGGCPLRQLIMAGEGNTDAGIVVIGMIIGAAIAHNFGLASSAQGATLNGQIAVAIGFILLTLIGLLNIKRRRE